MTPLLVLPAVVCCAAVPEVSIDSVRAAWLKRQHTVKSAAFRWSRKVYVPKGAMNFVLQSEAMEDLPPSDIILETPENSLWIEEGRVGYRTQLLCGTAKTSGRTTTPYRSAFDGTASRTLTRSTGFRYDEGCIHGGDRFNDLCDLTIRPALLHYRALDERFLHIDLARFEVDVRDVLINGQRCALLREKQPGRDSVWCVFAVVLSSHFEVLRYRQYVDGVPGRLYAQLDISYRPDPNYGPVPSEWQTTFFHGGAGRIGKVFEQRMLYSAFNEPVPAEELTLLFPAGTVVDDERTGERWIERGDGRRRIISDAESRSGVTYDELVSTETTNMASGLTRGRVLGLFALPVLAGVVFVFRWVRATLRSREAARRFE